MSEANALQRKPTKCTRFFLQRQRCSLSVGRVWKVGCEAQADVISIPYAVLADAHRSQSVSHLTEHCLLLLLGHSVEIAFAKGSQPPDNVTWETGCTLCKRQASLRSAAES